ncbi:MAG: glycosyltransferase, partial [Planctomycetota bacterium]
MRILYSSISYVPAKRASSVQVMKMCEAFSKRGHAVTLLTKKSNNAKTAEQSARDFEYYGVNQRFRIEKLPRPRYRGGGVLFLCCVVSRLWRLRKDTDLVFSRDLFAAYFATAFGHRVIFEAHGVPQGWLGKFALRRINSSRNSHRLVLISDGLRKDLKQLHLLPSPACVLIAHDGADPEPTSSEKSDCHKPEGTFRVGYIGSLYPGKGAETVRDLAKQ